MKTFIQGSQEPGALSSPGVVSIAPDGSATMNGVVQVYDDGTYTGLTFTDVAGNIIGSWTSDGTSTYLEAVSSAGGIISLGATPDAALIGSSTSLVADLVPVSPSLTCRRRLSDKSP